MFRRIKMFIRTRNEQLGCRNKSALSANYFFTRALSGCNSLMKIMKSQCLYSRDKCFSLAVLPPHKRVIHLGIVSRSGTLPCSILAAKTYSANVPAPPHGEFSGGVHFPVVKELCLCR